MIQIPQLKGYAKVWVLVLGLPVSAVAVIFFWESLPIHKWIGAATMVPYLLCLVSAQRGKVTKALKKL